MNTDERKEGVYRPAETIYKFEQLESLKYWKERYVWLLERYNDMLEEALDKRIPVKRASNMRRV